MIERLARILPDLEVQLAEGGEGPPVLVLHGGGGPATVATIAAHFLPTHRVLMPTHPGWNGMLRPDWLDSIDELAMVYLRLLAQHGLRDVLVVGSSIGGWIAAQMAVRDVGGLVGRLVLIDAVGVEIAGHPIADFFSLTPRGIAEHSYYEPDRFFVDPTTMPPERVALQRTNIASLRALAGEPYMHDPKLLARLRQVQVPTLVVWGDSDRIATPEYGAAYSRGFGNARFELVAKAGHMPQLERPDGLFPLLDAFLNPAP